jgi:hypothetical protein
MLRSRINEPPMSTGVRSELFRAIIDRYREGTGLTNW